MRLEEEFHKFEEKSFSSFHATARPVPNGHPVDVIEAFSTHALKDVVLDGVKHKRILVHAHHIFVALSSNDAPKSNGKKPNHVSVAHAEGSCLRPFAPRRQAGRHLKIVGPELLESANHIRSQFRQDASLRGHVDIPCV